MNPYRSHTCSQLRHADVDQRVLLCGWVHRKRDHGGLLFIDLRDDHGLTQCVALPDSDGFAAAEDVRVESVVRVAGQVVRRSEETVNPALDTGQIEVRINTIDILSPAAELPLPVFGEPDYPEDIRLTYRYLDLRRPALHASIKLRAAVISSLRRRMESLGFTEFQTPILTASSPEGARDFLVPSRLHPGQFYALPQAPQLFKQLVMISGFERYFQIAPCFRDEDARADRSPGEFYQLDVEMSFVTQDDVLNTIEPVITGLFDEFAPDRRLSDVPRIAWADAMLRYGTDKPDLRNPILCADVSDLFARPDVAFRAFANIVAGGGVVRAIHAPGVATRPRSFFDKLNDWARREMDAPGLGYVILAAGNGALTGKGPIAKFLPTDAIRAMAGRVGAGDGDAVFFAAGKKAHAEKLQAAARQRIAEELDLIDSESFAFCWIVDYPYFAWDESENRLDFSHNPFSMPQHGAKALDAADTDEKRLSLLAWQYDLVCNGVELSSGAIRNHDPELLIRAFETVGWRRCEVEASFSGLISALRHGAPPHGGIAPGIDRMVMLLAGASNIRDVILFPMNQRAQDLMMGAPGAVSPQQLADLGLRRIARSPKS